MYPGKEARWQEALELGEEIQGLTSALLEDAPPSEEVKVEAQAEPGEVRWRMCSRGETVYVLLANPTDQRASVVLTPGERVPQLLPPDRGSLVPPAPGGQCVVHLPPKDALTVVLSPP